MVNMKGTQTSEHSRPGPQNPNNVWKPKQTETLTVGLKI